MISFSQNGEDVLLNRAFGHIEHGFYVDVGANHPTQFSVTRHFYNRGWRGINLEPSSMFELLEHERPGDLNLAIAASNHDGEATLTEQGDGLGLSTLEPASPTAAGQRRVPCGTLRSIFTQHPPPDEIHFMSIDVEMHEMAVIEGNDWQRYRPKALVIEATRPNTNIPCHQDWEPLLLKAEYLFAHFDGINRYYVRSEDRALLEHFRTPVNVLDDYVVAAQADLQAAVRRITGDYRNLEGRWHELTRGLGARTLRFGLSIGRLAQRFVNLSRRLLGKNATTTGHASAVVR